MPERDWRLRIHDITDAIEKIKKYTAGMSFSEFHAGTARSCLERSIRIDKLSVNEARTLHEGVQGARRGRAFWPAGRYEVRSCRTGRNGRPA